MAVTFNGDADALNQAVNQLAQILTGEEEDVRDVGKGFAMAVGFAALSDIQEAFIIKSRGGTGPMGIRWEPLKPQTIANRKIGRGDPSLPNINPLRPSLNAAQDALWKQVFASHMHRFSVSMDETEAKGHAAAIAWNTVKALGAKTKIELLGSRQVEILKDTSVLINSLTPGVLSGAHYSPPGSDGGDQQVFDCDPGKIIIGTEVDYAGTHQFGSRHVPARPYLPRDENDIPDNWWLNWMDAAAQALRASLILYFR